MAGLRLDLREGAFAKRPNGTPVVPGDPDASLLYQRITSSNAALRMPPGYSHKELKPEQIALLKRWIEGGASWSGHWAFEPLERPAPPKVERESWIRNPIDRFLLARLESEGLEPAPDADRHTLIRRASIDIRGLPPTPEEVEQFVRDSAPNAYEKLVDRLLESPAYGEHRARYWLDAARYADTHGLHIDNYREMWPYRDWVIEAFNRNLPFDQFTLEQIAGDLLPNPTLDQLIATGFHRCNITTNEGGVIEDEVAAMYAKDRVDTTGAVWLGLTIGCATCHDHKFDPITQKDFYSFTAFFRNTTQKPLDGNIYDTPPVVVAPADEDRPRWAALDGDLAEARDNLEQTRREAAPKVADWISSARRDDIVGGRFDDSEKAALTLDDRVWLRTGDQTALLDRSAESRLVAGPDPGVAAIDLGSKGWLEASNADVISSDEPFTLAVRFLTASDEPSGTLASQIVFGEDDDEVGDRGWRLELSEGLPRITFYSDRGQDFGMRATGDSKVRPNQWHHVVVTYNGYRQRDGLILYLDGERLLSERTGRALRVLAEEIGVAAPLVIGARDTEEDGKTAFLKGAVADFRVLDRAVEATEARLLALWDGVETAAGKPSAELTERERKALAEYYLVRRNAPHRQAAERLAALEAERLAIMRRSPVTHIMREDPDSEPTAHILFRGMYDQPREEVPAATPGVLPPLAEKWPQNRLGLARWLVSDSNPLTARVTVNRFWQEVFGDGIVRTTEDFGSQGEPPTHPKLLDWLAVEFRESGWDVKQLFRLMLTSSAYRQAAAITPEKLEKDPENRLLSRGPRFRMDGEMIRDYALAASGLLTPEVGGPSVRPYQPPKVWETVAMKSSNTRFYEEDQGENLFRRSLYTFWKRAAPPPTMMVFNAPTREECTVRRERTNTPLQALVTMNGPQFFEASRALAQEAMHAAHNLEGRIEFMAKRLMARTLDARERQATESAYADYLSYYDSRPDDARRAVSVGDSDPDPRLDPAELAAWTMVANQLMNLDEVLNK